MISLEAEDYSEKPLRASASVSVAVRDVQDQPPAFLNAPYSANVAENTPPVRFVFYIWLRFLGHQPAFPAWFSIPY